MLPGEEGGGGGERERGGGQNVVYLMNYDTNEKLFVVRRIR